MNIIDSVIDTEKTRRNVRIMLPIMIHWAKTEQTHHDYDDLIKALGYKQYSGIGYPLGKIQDIIDHLEKSYGTQIPTLNSLVKDSPNGLPSHGFDYVIKLLHIMSLTHYIELQKIKLTFMKMSCCWLKDITNLIIVIRFKVILLSLLFGLRVELIIATNK